MAAKLFGVDDETLKKMNSTYKQSQNVTNAYNNTQNLLNQMNNYGSNSKYASQISGLMNNISNRKAFEYDPNKDTLFQNALAGYVNQGKTAMRDAMGQAAALTGGYGSSYGQAVGNQQYNEYIKGAYDSLADYYQMALNKYNAEGQDMYNKLNMYQQQDATEYGRLVDSYNANNSNWQALYNQEYGAWSDAVKNAQTNANMLNSDYWTKTKYDEDIRQYEKNFAEQQRQYDTTLAENQRQYNESLAENKRQYDTTLAENQRQYDTSFAENKRQYDTTFAENQRQFNQNYDLNQAKLAEDQRQFNQNYELSQAKLAEEKRQADAAAAAKNNESMATQQQKNDAAKAYTEGGEEGLKKYINSIPESKINQATYNEIIAYALDNATYYKNSPGYLGMKAGIQAGLATMRN